ncbi:MAG: NAD+ synthase [Puniceicoccaceae bacterium]
MKIGIAQINTIVGDLPGNLRLIKDAYHQLVDQGSTLVIFPELAISGYPPRDLLLRPRFLQACAEALQEIAQLTHSTPAILGFPELDSQSTNPALYNALAFCRNGRIEQVARKCLLPNYDVFDEDRYFVPSPSSLVVEDQGARLGLTICEDLWHEEAARFHHGQADPLDALAQLDLDLLINASASPWHRGKTNLRQQRVARAAQRCSCPVVYVNLVGGNDELIFDGRSTITAANGQILWQAPTFETYLGTVDLHNLNPVNEPSPDPLEEVHRALVLGLRDYAEKSGFSQAVLGLSGGIDSAVTAALAADALGPENVLGVALPSAISSSHSLEDAAALARYLGIDFQTLPIHPLVEAAEQTLSPLFQGLPVDVTEENIQARSRGLLLMALSNKFGRLLLTTGNKSEIAVGYCTLYGDMAGGLAVISDLPKTLVFDLAHHLNRSQLRIPPRTITKPPSAELRPDQKDEDSLPPYPTLDRILELYVEQHQSRAAIIKAGFDPGTVHEVCRKVDRNEYKRKQAAPGLKVTPLAFGVGRRIPIVQKFID